MRIELDIEYYKEQFYGDVLQEGNFNQYKRKAEALVNEMTFNRIRAIDLREEDEEAVKMAICAAAEALYENRKRDGIQSEHNDNYIVTYDLSRSVEEKARDEARIYLSATDLMNRQVNYDYKC